MDNKEIYDIIGIGIGPFNLSLAALLAPISECKAVFFDKKEEFDWHSGLSLEKSYLQSSFLRDLVTPVNPTSKYSFLSYLKSSKRLYQFFIANFEHVTRIEYNDYMKWVANELPSCKFNHSVESITYVDGLFHVVTNSGTYISKNIVLGSGLYPNKIFNNSLSAFHSSEYCAMKSQLDFSNKKIAVIGGGQSGAEIFQDLMNDETIDQLYWITKDKGFAPMDVSPFVSEIYTPGFSQYFVELDHKNKLKINSDHLFSSDGVSEDTLVDIYRSLYVRNSFKKNLKKPLLLAYREAIDFKNNTLSIRDLNKNCVSSFELDYIFCGTGYNAQIPTYLSNLNIDINLNFNNDFTIQWDGMHENKIFIQNMAKNFRGLADPNLSLMAWRSAIIINSLLGKEVYQISDCSETIMEFS